MSADTLQSYQKEIFDFVDSQPPNTELKISPPHRHGMIITAESARESYLYVGKREWKRMR